MGATARRLEALVETAPTWSEELDLDPPSPRSVETAREILALIPRDLADEHIRVFPSENGGITLQNSHQYLRVLDIEPQGFRGAVLLDVETGATEHFQTGTVVAAAEFLTADDPR